MLRFVIPNSTCDEHGDNNETNYEGPETSAVHYLKLSKSMSADLWIQDTSCCTLRYNMPPFILSGSRLRCMLGFNQTLKLGALFEVHIEL